MNMAMIQWHSKRQATVEGAVFGAEFVAMDQGAEELRGIRYKLRMMGVGIDVPTYVYGDNMSVIHNTLTPESPLTKKSPSICYHFNIEAIATKERLTTHVPTLVNWASLLTKVLSGRRRWGPRLRCPIPHVRPRLVSYIWCLGSPCRELTSLCQYN